MPEHPGVEAHIFAGPRAFAGAVDLFYGITKPRAQPVLRGRITTRRSSQAGSSQECVRPLNPARRRTIELSSIRR